MSYEIINESDFCVRHKNRRKHNQSFKLLFFTINLHFVTSNQIPTFRKRNLPLSSSIYLVFLPLEIQGWLKQTKVYHTYFYFVWKETTHKPLKMAAAKTLFSSVYAIGTTCFDECFYSMWQLEDINFHNSLFLLWYSFHRHVVAFFEATVLKEVRILCASSSIILRC